MTQLLEAFFTHGEAPHYCAGSDSPEDAKPLGVPDRGPYGSGEGCVLYLHGPSGSGQTSLLLQFGFTQAKAGKNVVLVMCGEAGASQQPAASEIMPLMACSKCGLPVQTGQDNEIWRRIHIKYLRSSVELQHFLCSLHMVGKETSVLLVDGFERFFASQSHMGNVYQSLAYLFEAREYMATSNGTGLAVVTGVSDAFLLRNRSLLRRWCRFLEIVPDTEEPNVFALREELDNVTEDCDSPSEVVPQPQVRYEFSPPDSQATGVFRLMQVLGRSGS